LRPRILTLLALAAALGVAGCSNGEPADSPAEKAHESQVEAKQDAAEKHCAAKGEIVAQGNDETTECVSMEEKQHEIERGEKSGPHYEAEQHANENDEQRQQSEETHKVEEERSGR
jgi:hypothetical protein